MERAPLPAGLGGNRERPDPRAPSSARCRPCASTNGCARRPRPGFPNGDRRGAPSAADFDLRFNTAESLAWRMLGCAGRRVAWRGSAGADAARRPARTLAALGLDLGPGMRSWTVADTVADRRGRGCVDMVWRVARPIRSLLVPSLTRCRRRRHEWLAAWGTHRVPAARKGGTY